MVGKLNIIFMSVPMPILGLCLVESAEKKEKCVFIKVNG